jgi:hypothetical protein
MTTNKAIRIKMSDGSHWTVRRVPRAYNCGGNLPKARIISGWEFEDHTGYTRFSEGSWMELVAMFRLVSENHGLTSNIS